MKKTLLAGALLPLFLSFAAFAGQQDVAQQKCINALNKGMAKLASVQSKVVDKCVGAFADGFVADAPACYDNDIAVQDARLDNCDAETAACVSPPDFGRTSCTVVNDAVQDEIHGLLSDVFGVPVNGGIASCGADEARCRCQAKVLKAVQKYYGAELKLYNACKKSGLKSGTAPVVDTAGLDACVGSDPKLLLAKAEDKLIATIEKACADVPAPFAEGSCTVLTGSNLASCLVTDIDCRACRTAKLSDALAIDCDVADDGVANSSCTP